MEIKLKKTPVCLISGSNGFLGRHLTKTLLQRQWRVIATDRMAESAVANCEYHQCNLADLQEVLALPFDEIDVFFHLASAGVKAAGREWPICFDANINGAIHLMNGLQKSARHPKIVYAHTFYEDYITRYPDLKKNPYIATKSTATALWNFFASQYSGTVVGCKLFQVYGDGDDPANLISYLIHSLSRREEVLLGGGSSIRDWIYVEDVVRGLIAAATTAESAGAVDYELGRGQGISISQVAETVAELLQAPRSLLNFDPSRDRDENVVDAVAKNFPPDWNAPCDLKSGIRQICKIKEII